MLCLAPSAAGMVFSAGVQLPDGLVKVLAGVESSVFCSDFCSVKGSAHHRRGPPSTFFLTPKAT